MKILWIINVSFPLVELGQNRSKAGIDGGWIFSLADALRENGGIELGVAFVDEVEELRQIKSGDVTFFIIPGGLKRKVAMPDANYAGYADRILGTFKPDLIHVHGTEYQHSLYYLMHAEIPVVVSIQGLLYKCREQFFGGLSLTAMVKQNGPCAILDFLVLYLQRMYFSKRIPGEFEILRLARNVIGRTSWDRSNVFAENQNIKYYHCGETLRREFWESHWKRDGVEQYSIFAGNAGVAYKGFHRLIEAAGRLKAKYPNLKVYVAGKSQKPASWRDWKRRIGYSAYLARRIKELGLQDSVIYTGVLSAGEMADRLCHSHVFVLPSSIENSPNTLGEAMLVGTPSIAACVGGVLDMVEHGKDVLVYRFEDTEVLARLIDDIWSDDDLAIRLSEHARQRARKNHDGKIICATLVHIYGQVIADEGAR